MSKRKAYVKAVLEALIESSFSVIKEEGKAKLGVTDGRDLAYHIKVIEDMVIHIGLLDENWFSVELRKGAKILKMKNKKAWHFCNEAQSLNSLLEYYPFHQFSPHMSIFIKHVEDMGIGEILRISGRENIDMAVSSLNECLRRIRLELYSDDFICKVKKDLRRVNKNFESLKCYVGDLFRVYARILVLRVDLTYLNKHCDKLSGDVIVSYEEVKAHRERIFRDLREKILSNYMVGYVWKLEYGIEKGYHYHVLIFLDGSKVSKDVIISKMVGDHWASKVTEGKGLYYNCNVNKEGYRFCGIGMVNHFDMDKRGLLNKAAFYLTKIDYFIRFVAPDGGRTFGKGCKPNIETKRLGRPRKYI